MPALPNVPPQPQVQVEVVDKTNRLTELWRRYVIALDAALRAPLTNAANDAAAAAAGVPVNGLYRNGNAVQVRLT
jgi:hypothetical protein